jgi:uncharacterized protein (DUF1697 family)
MAVVVFLKGVNVGGHRTFRPSVLVNAWSRFDAVNIGAAGTFVFRKPSSQAALRTEIVRRLPFETDVIVCYGRDILSLIARDPFAAYPKRPDVVPFVSVLARRRGPTRPLPCVFPAAGAWGVRIIACHDRFVLGMYRRHMKAIRYLAQVEKVFGVPATTRNWNTILAIGRILRPDN